MTDASKGLRALVVRVCSATLLLLHVGCSVRNAEPLLPAAKGFWKTSERRYSIELNGTVLVDGSVLFRISQDGRITDASGAVVATVQRDGELHGPDGAVVARLGTTGVRRSGEDTPWFWIDRDGTILLYTEGRAVGLWQGGCRGADVVTCSLVTYLILRREPGLLKSSSATPVP